jgi:hypothetical protein
MINMSVILVMLLCASVSAMLAFMDDRDIGTFTGVGATIGFLLCKNAFVFLEATTMTVLVTYVLEPAVVEQADHSLYRLLRTTDPINGAARTLINDR